MKIGFVGWRGMVGSVLFKRFDETGDFDRLKNLAEIKLFSTSLAGRAFMVDGEAIIEDANSIPALKKCDIIVTCQGGDWTSKMHSKLRFDGWRGIWIDTASSLRMKEKSIIVLDPLNRKAIEDGLKNGILDFVGGNCTVSLMLMACHGLFKEDLVEWINSATYQAASGAGSACVQELVRQMQVLTEGVDTSLDALDLEKLITRRLRTPRTMPTDNFGVPLAGNLIPWIDRAVEGGQTREEWKGFAEANKILGFVSRPVPIDGICVRVGAIRCHSQNLHIKLKRDVPLEEIAGMMAGANQWVKIVPNNDLSTKRDLSPVAVSGTLEIAVGRLRKSTISPKHLLAFTVGDQLLWGAAEPIRRLLGIILGYL